MPALPAELAATVEVSDADAGHGAEREEVRRRAREAAASAAYADFGKARHFPAVLTPRCPLGHVKTYRWAGDGVWRCRTCQAAADARYRAKKPPRPAPTTCRNGHPLTPDNVDHPRCRLCEAERRRRYRSSDASRAYQREWQRRKRAEAGVTPRLKRRTYP